MKAFAQLLEEYFQESARAEGIERRRFRIAGHAVTVQFCRGRWSDEMTDAIAHLERPFAADEQPALTISMWDGRSQPGNHLLRAYLFTLTNWWFDYTGKRGDLLDIHSDRVAATYHPGTAILSVVDLDNDRGFYWKSDASPMPYYEACSPFRSVLHRWMRKMDAYFVHGAGIGNADGGVLLVGKGGSGKSTSTLSCLRSSLQVAGDDYCIVSRDPHGGLDVNSLYCTAKLIELSNLEAFPEMAANVINPVREPGEKVALSLRDYAGSKLIDRFPLRAILVPVITGALHTHIGPCSAHEALMALAPSTLSQLPASGASDLQFLGALTRQVRCYRIMLGTDLPQVPEKIAALLESLREENALATTAFAG